MIADHPNPNRVLPEDAHRFLSLLARPGDVFELRALTKRDGKQQISAGFFDDMKALAQAAIERSGRDDGIYITLNPVHRGLLSRLPANRVQRVGNGDSTSDRDVVARRHLLIDIDPTRPAGISSDDVEHAAALDLARRMQSELTALSWPEPLLADSGNGAHLIYAIDLPRDDGKLVERVLGELSKRFSTPTLKVDEKVFNPARISKIYGTLTRKGQSTPDRPHRVSRIRSAPQVLTAVPRDLLEAFAPGRAAPARSTNGHAHPPDANRFDLAAFISQYLPDAEEQPWTGGEHGQRKWLIPVCPFNTTHDRKEAFIVEMHSGAISAGCKHDSCFKTWHELRERLDPGVYERRQQLRAPASRPDQPEVLYEDAGFTARIEAEIDVFANRDRDTNPLDGIPHPSESPDPSDPDIQARYRLTEIGNAQRLADANAGRLRYVHPWKAWLAWDGRRWKRDASGAELEAAKAVVEHLFGIAEGAGGRADKLATEHAEVIATAKATARTAEAKKVRDEAMASPGFRQTAQAQLEVAAIAAWAKASATWKITSNMVKLASTDPRLVAHPEEFDRDPWIINMQNGTLDLRTCELRPHRQADGLTKIAGVNYDATAKAPRWERFLVEVQPDPEMRAWLQRWFGYCLTGSIAEQVMMFALGDGNNGKNVLLDTLKLVMGDYAATSAPDLLVLKNNDEHPTGFADLQGHRLMLVSEIDHGRKWAEATIKRLTGDKTIKARHMRKDFYEFEATHKFVVLANNKPEVQGTDHGIWRRIRLAPFSTIIPEDKKDEQLLTKLSAERDGIFAWAVRGCIAWQRDRLGQAPLMRQAVAEYRADQDQVGEWISERCMCVCGEKKDWDDATGICVTCGAAGEIHAVDPDKSEEPWTDLFPDFRSWQESRGVKSQNLWTLPRLRGELLKRPGITQRRTKGWRGIHGIRLRRFPGATVSNRIDPDEGRVGGRWVTR